MTLVTEETMDSYLEHYGRLGMKWYEHRFGKEDGRAKYVEKFQKKEKKKIVKNQLDTERQTAKAVHKLKKSRKSDKILTINNLQSQLDEATKVNDRLIKTLGDYTIDDIMKEQRYLSSKRTQHIVRKIIHPFIEGSFDSDWERRMYRITN